MDLSGDHWWDAAREREWAAILRLRPDGDVVRAMQYVASPRWVPSRPPPRLPTKWAIASYWAQRDDWFDVILGTPHCFACYLPGGFPEDVTEPEARWNLSTRLERGHIVNRARDGLDGAQNLVPLCGTCNHFMPIFDVEHDKDATAWIFAGGIMGEFDLRLEAQGMNWAERGLAWLEIMEQRGGVVLPRGLTALSCREMLIRRHTPSELQDGPGVGDARPFAARRATLRGGRGRQDPVTVSGTGRQDVRRERLAITHSLSVPPVGVLAVSLARPVHRPGS